MHSSGGTSATFWGLGSFPDRRRPRRPPPLPSTLPPPPLDAPALAATAALAAASAALAAALALTAAAQRAALHPAALHRCMGWRELWSPTRAWHCATTRALTAATSAAASLAGAALAARRSSACPQRNEEYDKGLAAASRIAPLRFGHSAPAYKATFRTDSVLAKACARRPLAHPAHYGAPAVSQRSTI